MSRIVPRRPEPPSTETVSLLGERSRSSSTRGMDAEFWGETVAIVGLTILAIVTSFLFLRV
jgi:hypothetical protein